MLDTRENIYKVNTINGTDIFFDTLYHRYFYWQNAKKRTSVYLSKLVNRLKKQVK